jgi:16S rRNA (cytidine1402-2'-O)-methyltransferase
MLTFVPTPLGNLRDITLRAIDELRACDLVVAEDTRVARRLLAALDLPGKPMFSYREQNARNVTAEIVSRAVTEHIVVVTDAGTPGISDPGGALVREARAAGISVDVLPGPCAFVVAIVLSGFAYDELVFAGFVPRRIGERNDIFLRAFAAPGVTAFYESPKRVVSTLEAIDALDASGQLFLAREMTKKFEQQISGTAREILSMLELPVRGEIVLIIKGGSSRQAPQGETTLGNAIEAALAGGASAAAAAKTLARAGFGERAELYRRIVAHAAARSAKART